MLNLLSLIVGVLYIIVGITVINTQSFGVKLDPTIANAFGALLCCYGIFRIIRAIIRLRKKNENL